MLLIGAGALLLLVSLFLEWYQPGVDAWEIFEVWDLVLAVLAITALVAVAGRLGFAPPRPASWLLAPAIAALVIVLFAIINPPPLVGSLGDGDPGTGLWLALASAVLMAAGAVLSVARISVAISSRRPAAGRSGAPRAAARSSGAARPPHRPRRSRRPIRWVPSIPSLQAARRSRRRSRRAGSEAGGPRAWYGRARSGLVGPAAVEVVEVACGVLVVAVA